MRSEIYYFVEFSREHYFVEFSREQNKIAVLVQLYIDHTSNSTKKNSIISCETKIATDTHHP